MKKLHMALLISFMALATGSLFTTQIIASAGPGGADGVGAGAGQPAIVTPMMLPGLISESYKTAGPARVEIPFDMTGGYYNPMGMDPEMADPDYDDARMAAAGPGGAAGIVAAAAAGPVGGGIFMDENIYAPVAPLPAPLLEPSPVPQGTATLDNEKFLKDLGPIDDYDRYVAMMTESQKTDAAGKVLADFLAAWNAYKTATSSYGRTMNLDAMKLSLRKFYRLGKIEQLEIAKKMLRDVIGQ